MKKMNNKGFSLVELIVVVLIMAIIAVALAPQVMKWVENSRVSTDCTNYESMVENLQLAISDKEVYKNFAADTTPATVYVTINTKGTSISTTAGGDNTAAGTASTASITDSSNPDTALIYGLSKIDAGWPKIAKKASAKVGSSNNDDYYRITVTTGKQCNVARDTNLSPDKLKQGTDLS